MTILIIAIKIVAIRILYATFYLLLPRGSLPIELHPRRISIGDIQKLKYQRYAMLEALLHYG